MGIKRIEISVDEIIEQDDYIEYTIVHADESVGSATLRITTLDSSHHMGYVLRDQGIALGSNVAELFFYPNTQTSIQRQGVGSEALDFVLQDAKTRGIRVMYCEVTSMVATQFFRKKEFKGNYEPHCYKIIS